MPWALWLCSTSPAPSCCALPRAGGRGLLWDPTAQRPQPSLLLCPPGLLPFPGAEPHTALYSHLVCPACPCPSRSPTHSSAWNPEQSPHLPPGQSQHLGGPECSSLIHSISWKGEGKAAPGVTLPCPWSILEHAWLLKHKVFFAFLSLGCLRRGWRSPVLALPLPSSCARSALSGPELFSRPGEMSCRFGCELTVLLLFGRGDLVHTILYNKRKKSNLLPLSSLCHTHTLVSSVPDKSFFPFQASALPAGFTFPCPRYIPLG